MTVSCRPTGLGWRTVTTVFGRIGGVWKPLNVSVKPAGLGFRPVVTSADLSAEVAPTSLWNVYLDPGDNSDNFVSSGGTTVTPSGGTAPYTYAWSQVSGDFMSITHPTLATTDFVADVVYAQSASAIFQCTVTDSNGAQVSVLVAVDIEPE